MELSEEEATELQKVSPWKLDRFKGKVYAA
jgi:hypothetical protein